MPRALLTERIAKLDPAWMEAVCRALAHSAGFDHHEPRGAPAMSVRIAGIEFEHHVSDERADVLYLTVGGYEGLPADADATPEGHGIE